MESAVARRRGGMRGRQDRRPSLLHAFGRDALGALRSGPLRAFLALELLAAAYLVLRRGPSVLPLLAVIGAGATAYGFLAWQAGRSPWAEPRPDLVRAPRLELLAVAVGYVALSGSLLGWWPRAGVLPPAWTVFQAALVGWVVVATTAWLRAARRDGRGFGELAWIWRGWLPFVPLLLAVLLPKAPLQGMGFVAALIGGIGSGVSQQVLLQVGLTARLEAVLGRGDAAAVLAALGFGAVHVAMNLPQAGGDWPIAAANAMVLQASIGLVFCTAYLRHRAPLALGCCHAALMA